MFDDMHRPTILGSSEVPFTNITKLIYVDTDEDYKLRTAVICSDIP